MNGIELVKESLFKDGLFKDRIFKEEKPEGSGDTGKNQEGNKVRILLTGKWGPEGTGVTRMDHEGIRKQGGARR